MSELPPNLPALPEGWMWRPLGALLDPDRGISYGIVQPGQHDPNGIPIIRVNDFSDGQIIADDVRRVSPEIESKYSRTRLQGGEVLLTLVGSIGQSAVVPDEFAGWNLARAVGLIPVHPDIDSRWITFCLKSPLVQHYVDVWANTTVQATLNLGDVEQLPIPVPPDDEMERLTGYLANLEDKIELNRQMNATLEAIARAIFKSWFVDFDPVWAKAEGRDPGLPEEIAALFPDSFEESELGRIPAGWEIDRLDRLFVLQRGFDLPTRKRVPGEYPILSASGITGTHDEFMVEGPGVTTGRSGLLGEVFYIDKDFWPLNTSLWVREFRIATPLFAYHFLKTIDLPKYNSGSAVPSLNRNYVHNLNVIIPPNVIVNAFETIVYPLFHLRKQNRAESETLIELRDTLLPKLISGEIRVNEISSTGENVA
jgi:type I restriction enzyme S subunit